MKVVNVVGPKGAGKTTLIEYLVKELSSRGYAVGVISELSPNGLPPEEERLKTYRYSLAGASTIALQHPTFSELVFKSRLPYAELLDRFCEDFVLLENATEVNAAEISVDFEDGEPAIGDLTFAIGGRYAETHDGMLTGIPVFSKTNIEKLATLIEKVLPLYVPNLPDEACHDCGKSCREMLSAHLKGEDDYARCLLLSDGVIVNVDGKTLNVPKYVKRLLKSAVVNTLSDTPQRDGSIIEVRIVK